MKDARERHVKRPDDPATYIPRRCQTYAAPVSYALHNLLTPPSYDWSKIAGKDPIRFNCRDEALQLLAPPQLLEDVNFAGPLPSLPATVSTKLAFNVDAASLQRAEANYADAFANERQLQSLLVKEDGSKASAAATSADIAAKFSGLAMWPTLVLDDDAATLVKSRGANGEAQKSHWQTVLQLLADAPVAVAAGTTISLAFDAKLDKDVTKAAAYKLGGSIA